ncbi:MAG: endonuclease domain-containing protein [Pseudomonadota bacterium]|nr:endonuclease domain-containing protein [Pseudomonadota bacterium]
MTAKTAPSPPKGERAGVRGRDFARELRRKETDAEHTLWRHLRDRQLDGCKFRRQHPIGPYIADFACPERLLIVELDGGQHAERGQYDKARTRYLGDHGWRVVRFWDNEALLQTDSVLERILSILCNHPSPQPSPRKRGEGDKRPDPCDLPRPRRGRGLG